MRGRGPPERQIMRRVTALVHRIDVGTTSDVESGSNSALGSGSRWTSSMGGSQALYRMIVAALELYRGWIGRKSVVDGLRDRCCCFSSSKSNSAAIRPSRAARNGPIRWDACGHRGRRLWPRRSDISVSLGGNLWRRSG